MAEILKSLRKNKLSNILIFLQIALSLLYFFMVATSIQKAFNTYLEVPKVVDVDLSRLIHIEIQAENVPERRFQDFYNSLKEHKSIKSMGAYHNSSLTSPTF